MPEKPKIRIGTRGSMLARWQADWVAARLTELGIEVEIVLISTVGDQQQVGSIGSLGSVGVFTKEIQKALLDKRVDLAVHSLKDLPTDPQPELHLTTVPAREAEGDCLISRAGEKFDQLPARAKIGTGSLRRQAQLKHARRDVQTLDIRGNVETRLRKLDDGEYDAIVLAEAGLKRLGFADRITQVFAKSIMLPAVGQGALGLEIRADDEVTAELLAPLDHARTHASVVAERMLLAELRGGCMAPVGAWGRVDAGGELQLDACVLSGDGRQRIDTFVTGPPQDAVELGRVAAERLLGDGAAELIQAARNTD